VEDMGTLQPVCTGKHTGSWIGQGKLQSDASSPWRTTETHPAGYLLSSSPVSEHHQSPGKELKLGFENFSQFELTSVPFLIREWKL
jgi:hypothetical protein